MVEPLKFTGFECLHEIYKTSVTICHGAKLTFSFLFFYFFLNSGGTVAGLSLGLLLSSVKAKVFGYYVKGYFLLTNSSKLNKMLYAPFADACIFCL